MDKLGLILNMAGTLVLVIFAFPQPDFGAGGQLVVNDNNPHPSGKTFGEVRARARSIKILYRIIAILGLGLLFVGFLLQLIALYKK
jgi:hypothetical protein